uniref:Uncharacterized protein n=1 Tax=Anguilla anguilla TaxID=7936 RepID=A0A0E9QGQ0_ANGAN
MHIAVCGVLCALRTNFRIYKAHFKHPFPCVMYSMNNLVLFELYVCVGGYREDVFADLSPKSRHLG